MMTIDNDPQTDSPQKEEKKKDLVRFDWAMKYLLRNKANFDVLEGFLSELLKQNITIVTLLESEGNQEDEEDKYNRVDVLVKADDESHIIVEVQCRNQADYPSRILYGTSKIILENMVKGKPYIFIKKVISVSILFFELGEGEDYIYHGKTHFQGIHNKDTLLLKQGQQEDYKKHLGLSFKEAGDVHPEYYILMVDKFKKRVKDKLDEWMYFFKTEEIEPGFTAKGLPEAKEKLDTLKLSKEERARYNRFMDRLSTEKSVAITYFGDGLKEGEEKGRKEEKITLAKKLMKKMSIEEVSDLTELSIEEIRKLTYYSGPEKLTF